MYEDVVGYPLAWPVTFPRLPDHERKAARFDTSLAAARDGLLDDLRIMGAHDVVISSNIPLRQDGMPYARYSPPRDPAVAVYFTRDGEQKCMPCDRWTRVEDNLQAIRKTIQALRGIDRWATGSVMDATFQGLTALPPVSIKGWWTVLQVPRDTSSTDVESQYRWLAKRWHPDSPGGDNDKFLEIQEAYEQFRSGRKAETR